MQIVENWSRIRGRVEAWQPPRKAGESGVLTIAVADVEDVPSPDGSDHHRNLLTEAAGKTVHVVVPASAAQHIAARKGSTAVVRVRRGPSTERVFAHPDHITVTP
ncbi:MAG: hypothetical protein ACRD2I_16890 [Vicinamibacterales bacterium]